MAIALPAWGCYSVGGMGEMGLQLEEGFAREKEGRVKAFNTVDSKAET